MRRANLHGPVLFNEVLSLLQITSGKNYLDLTFGMGGHSQGILQHGAESLLAIDRDPSAIEEYQRSPLLFSEKRLQVVRGKFSQLSRIVNGKKFHGILMDLGLSSKQLLSPGRGFSFHSTGPLDMRIDRSQGETLEDILNRVTRADLEKELYRNTGNPKSRLWAKRIMEALHAGRLKNCEDLVGLFQLKVRHSRIQPSTIVLMGLRMMVNGELREIETAVPQAVEALQPGGRLIILSFHSVEDRLVKRLLRQAAGLCICGKDPLFCRCCRVQLVKFVNRKAIFPSSLERIENPRSRSAKLRCVEKLSSGG